MKALAVSLSLVLALALVSPTRAHATTQPFQFVILVMPHVVAAVLDLQDAWNCYLEGFRRRHPSPRPAVPRPDSIPAKPAPTAPEIMSPAPALPGSSTSAPVEL